MKHAWATLLVVWLAVGSGCSLLELDFPLRCEPRRLKPGETIADYDDPCAALNQGRDLSESCLIYQCRGDGKGCQLRPRDLDGDDVPACSVDQRADAASLDCDDSDEKRSPLTAERCDGMDNDCDGQIDEKLAYRAVELARRVPAENALGSLLSVRPVPLSSTSLVILATRARPPQNAEPPSGVLSQSEAIYLDRDGNQRSEQLAHYQRGEGEPNAECVGGMPCYLSALSATLSGPRLLFAARNLLGCARGQLLLGAADAALDLPSPLQFVDEGAASGLCENDSPAKLGLPQIASLGADQALDASWLVVWKDDADGAILALGDRLEGGAFATSSGRKAQVLGHGSSAPSVVAWHGAQLGNTDGYLVAYPGAGEDCDGGPQLHFLAEDRLQSPLTSCPSAQAVEDVTLAASSGPAPASDRARDGLALAWRSQGTAFFTPLVLDLDEAGLRFAAEEPLQLGQNVVAGPRLTYVPAGFRAPSEADRGEGGWWVVWLSASPTRLMGARIAEGEISLLEDPFELWAAEEGNPDSPLFVTALPAGKTEEAPFVVFGLASSAPGGELRTGTVTCAP